MTRDLFPAAVDRADGLVAVIGDHEQGSSLEVGIAP